MILRRKARDRASFDEECRTDTMPGAESLRSQKPTGRIFRGAFGFSFMDQTAFPKPTFSCFRRGAVATPPFRATPVRLRSRPERAGSDAIVSSKSCTSRNANGVPEVRDA